MLINWLYVLGRPTGSISMLHFQNLREKLTLSEIQTIRTQLLTEKWLCEGTEPTLLTLGPRALTELIQFFRELEMPICPVCTYDTLIGISCPTNGCSTVRLHRKCASEIMKRSASVLYKCPKCLQRIPLDAIEQGE